MITPDTAEKWADSIIEKPEDYDRIEVHGVRQIADPHSGDTLVEVDDDNPEFWSVYVHLIEGGVECIGDFGRLEAARKYALEISDKHGWETDDYTTGGDNAGN